MKNILTSVQENKLDSKSSNLFDKLKSLGWIMLIAIFSSNCDNQPKINEENLADNKNIFSTPFSDIQIEKTIYEISNAQDTVLFSKNGSKIIIPQNAFLDKDGKIIDSPVKLSFREFTNAFDIYLAGIPMLYDSAGIEQVFETAGMLEINAYSQGRPVFPNPKNKIQVKMSSFQKESKYNVYYLDTNTGKWAYAGKDDIEINDYEKSKASLPQIPPMPKKATQYSFSIGDDTGKYPELNVYKNVLFEPVDKKRCGYNSTEIKIKDSGNGIYDVIFIVDAYGVHKEQTCRCYLAFKEGADYDNAMKVYQNKYKFLIDKRDAMKKEIEEQWEKYLEVKRQYNQLGFLDLFNKKEVANLEGEEKIIRTLDISGFGFINCDFPSSYPQGAEIIAKYKDAKGNPLNLKNIALIEKGRNAIFRYETKIKFNPQQENILWGITIDNKLAYFKAEDFKKVNQTNGEYTFIMNVSSV